MTREARCSTRGSGRLGVHPFADLGRQLARARRKRLAEASKRAGRDGRAAREARCERAQCCASEAEMFLEAMADVCPLSNRGGPEAVAHTCRTIPQGSGPKGPCGQGTDAEALLALVEGRTPWPVEDTPEYVSGGHPGLVRGLHHGTFAVQAYCDLHGLDRGGALDACRAFFAQALSEDKRCVALIHGRGLSSPEGPVLKKAVLTWLARGPYRRSVLAFSSAPAWDGGAGVTYVLLWRRPVTRLGLCKAGGCGRI